MFWQSSTHKFNNPIGSMTKHIQSHYTTTFREVLIGGIVFLLVGIMIFQPLFQQHSEYYLWLAGFAATLAMAFVFAVVSVRINGYKRYKDTLLGFVTGVMFLLCGGLAIIGFLHL